MQRQMSSGTSVVGSGKCSKFPRDLDQHFPADLGVAGSPSHLPPAPRHPSSYSIHQGIFMAQGVLRTSCGWSSFLAFTFWRERISPAAFFFTPPHSIDTLSRLSVSLKEIPRKRPLSLERGSLGPLNRK